MAVGRQRGATRRRITAALPVRLAGAAASAASAPAPGNERTPALIAGFQSRSRLSSWVERAGPGRRRADGPQLLRTPARRPVVRAGQPELGALVAGRGELVAEQRYELPVHG